MEGWLATLGRRPDQDWALFLDVDGTLLDIADHPDAVVVPGGLVGTIERVANGLGGALALVSGRPIADVDRLFDSHRLVVAGQHGAEVRSASGALARVDGPPSMARTRQLVAGLARGRGGLLVEDKGATIAVHHRAAPDAGPWLRAMLSRLDGLETIQGKDVVEVRPRGCNKGAAVDRLMASPPFAGRRPAFVGDDVTDEDGFRAVLRRGGVAIQVGPRHSMLTTCRIAEPAGVRRWLGALERRLHDGDTGCAT